MLKDNSIEYGGKHFEPVRKFNTKDGNFRKISLNLKKIKRLDLLKLTNPLKTMSFSPVIISGVLSLPKKIALKPLSTSFSKMVIANASDVISKSAPQLSF